jgi:AmmeMemoRadiSam system protein B
MGRRPATGAVGPVRRLTVVSGDLVRKPTAAGGFYPSEPVRLAAELDALIQGAATGGEATTGETPPHAVIVPHAGYRWSGPVAASAYVRLTSARGAIGRVVLVGPAHFVPLDGMALSSAAAFATPLGDVPVDADLHRRALTVRGVVVDDAAHRREHSLEVQLPFLQRVLGDFTVLPVAVGRVGADDLADLLDAVGRGSDTLVVGSSDLSHYLDQSAAVTRDARTARAISAADGDSIGPSDACGAFVLRGTLAWGVRHGLRPRLLDLRTSADAGGPPERVVGYGAFAFEPIDAGPGGERPSTGGRPGR